MDVSRGLMLVWCGLGLGVLASCFDEVGERPPCFDQGAISADDLTHSKICCDPMGDWQSVCEGAWQDAGLGHLAKLTVCLPEGVCGLDCTAGVNCECRVDGDCDGVPAGVCEVSQSAAECEAHGFDAPRCAVCVSDR